MQKTNQIPCAVTLSLSTRGEEINAVWCPLLQVQFVAHALRSIDHHVHLKE